MAIAVLLGGVYHAGRVEIAPSDFAFREGIGRRFALYRMAAKFATY